MWLAFTTLPVFESSFYIKLLQAYKAHMQRQNQLKASTCPDKVRKKKALSLMFCLLLFPCVSTR